jgi:hypothetical protein
LTVEGASDAFTVVCRSARARRGGRGRRRFLPSGGSAVRCERVKRQSLVAAVCIARSRRRRPTHSDDSLPAIEAHADLILSLDEAQPELFLRELRDALAEHGVQTSTSGLSRFFARHSITRKKGHSTRLSRSGLT